MTLIELIYMCIKLRKECRDEYVSRYNVLFNELIDAYRMEI